MIKERDIEAYLKKRVQEHGGEYRRVQWIGRRGAPDDIVFLRGAHFVECKAPGKEPEPHQEREHNRMRAQGIAVTVLDTHRGVDLFLEGVLS